MDGIIQTLSNFIAWVQPATYIMVAAALVINGVLCIIGGEAGREKAKKALPWVAIGSVLVIGAVTFGSEIVDNISF